jgi:hypothetical protein
MLSLIADEMIDDDVGKLQMQPVKAYERPMAKVDVKDRVWSACKYMLSK